MSLTQGTDSWCSIAQVQRRLIQWEGKIGNSGDTLNDADLEAMIKEQFPITNGRLAGLGLTRAELAADAQATLLLSRHDSLRVAADVVRSMNALVAGEIHSIADTYAKDADALLELLATSKVQPGSAESERDGAVPLPASVQTGGKYVDPRWTFDRKL